VEELFADAPETPDGTRKHPAASVVERLRSRVPEEELKKAPSDLARNIDHYLYGHPKEVE
jgi:hypothetical protein